MTYLTHDIPVSGGLMRVGEWRPDDPDAPLIIALHGMTASHLSWQFLATALPEARIVAPDLRGRGRSAELPQPYGLAQHLADLRVVMAALRIENAPDTVLVAHSLGAFVAAAAAAERPSRFRHAILADGGLPVTVPLNIDDDDLVEAVLGVAVARRTELTFTSPAIYRKFWRLHPGFASCWSDELAAVADYDLTEVIADDGELAYRPVACRTAIETDARELFGSHAMRAVLEAVGQPPKQRTDLAPDSDASTAGPAVSISDAPPALTVLTAPRGLLNEAPGVYSSRDIERWKAELPHISFVEVENVNHFSLVMSARGANAIAREYRRVFVRA